MHLAIRQHHSGTTCILNGEFRLAVFPGYSSYGAAEMVAGQRLDVLDLKGLDVQVVESQEGDGVVGVEAEGEGAQEVFATLEGGGG